MAKITRGSNNVFRDIGFGKQEAANLLVRSTLMVEIERYITREGLTQVQAAKIFGVSQPRVSNLVRGKIDLFTTDMLINMLAAAGLTVRVQISKKRAA